MSDIKKYSKQFSKNSTSDEALMIVDMQERFLENKKKNKYTEQHRILRKMITKKVIERLEFAQDLKKEVIIVEYEWDWETIPEIMQKIKKKAVVIHKNDDWLLTSWNNYRWIASETLKNKEIKNIEVVWINTSACVISTMVSLLRNWFNPILRLDATMNNLFMDTEIDFLENNRLKMIYNDYSKTNQYIRRIECWKLDEIFFKFDELIHRCTQLTFRNIDLTKHLYHPKVDFNYKDDDIMNKFLWEL